MFEISPVLREGLLVLLRHLYAALITLKQIRDVATNGIYVHISFSLFPLISSRSIVAFLLKSLSMSLAFVSYLFLFLSPLLSTNQHHSILHLF